MSISRAIDNAIQVAEALAVLHGRGLVHRDLKPDNVMIRPGDQTVLIDLGIAKHTGDFQKTMDHLTQDGILIGTPGYFPPEGGMAPDAPTMDCFALGVTLYEMLTKTRPFLEAEKLGMIAYLDVLREGGYPPASSINPNVPRAVDVLIARFLEVDARERVQDGAEAVRVLQELAVAVNVRRDGPTAEIRAPGRPSDSGAVSALAGGTVRKPSGRVPQAMSAQKPVPQSPQAAAVPPHDGSAYLLGLAFLAVGTVVVAISSFAFVKFKPVPTPTITPAPSVVTPTATESPASQVAEYASLARDLRTALRRQKLEAGWVRSFASRHRAALKSAPTSLAGPLKEELREGGLLALLERFLSHASVYFSTASIPESERWATRAALCDVEILEAFCGEHKIPWPLPFKVADRTRQWDDLIHPMEIDISKGRTWGRHRGDNKDRGYFPGGVLEDRWEVSVPSATDRILVWFVMTRAQPHVVLDVTVAGLVRKILRPSGRKNPPVLPAISFVSMMIDGCTNGPDCVRGPHILRPPPSHQEKNTYLGFWMPRSHWKSPETVKIRMVELPYTASLDNPILWERYVTLLPVAP